MKITLFALNASFVHTNLAVRCIAGALAAHGYAPTVLERSLKDRTREVLYALAETAADIYGFSVYIWNRSEMLSLAADLHTLCPLARIVFGGPEISFEDESFFARYPFVDNIIAGDGEEAFVSYVQSPPPVHTVLHGTPFSGFVENGILYDAYLPDSHSGGILYYESSRGCPFSCAYCLSSATSGVRAKSAEQTVADLRLFEKMDGVRVVKFVDRTFNFDRRRADAIWRALAGDGFTKTYHFEICADLLDEENFATLAAMPKGRIQLECGVQSTNPATLAEIHRTADPAKIIAALTRVREMRNIHLHADLIAGLPHEGFARFAQSFDALYPACDLLQLSFLKLLPGTDLRARCTDMGYRYSACPPYEVLCSDALTFEELHRLHGIDEVLDRFGGSGHFAHTFDYAMKYIPSPFAFFDSLAATLPAPRSLSQRAAFLALRERLLPICRDVAMLDGYLALDWYLWENGSLPHGIEADRHSHEAEVRRAFCASHPNTHPSSISVLSLLFAKGQAVVIDRLNHIYKILPQ